MDAAPPLPPDLVREFVTVAHGALDRVTALLDEQPRLVNAVWDWGGGDFESALGAASHTGSREIALLLLSKGARVDLFCAAMLGWLEVVRAFAAADPACLTAPGPHGIPLLVHAELGGGPAVGVLAFLREEGAAG